MVKLVIILRAGARAHAAESYNDFLIKIDALPGMRRKSVSTVYGAAGRPSPYSTLIEATFDSRAAMEAALTGPAGIAAGNALLQFAGPDAITLFADVLEEEYPAAAAGGEAGE